MSSISTEILPKRLVLNCKNNSLINGREVTKSLGIIAYCLTTKKWLLVEPKYSHGFQIIVLARYLPLQLYQLTSSLTKKEINIILQLCDTAFDSVKFREIFTNIFPETTLADSEYRFQNRGEEIKEHLQNLIPFYKKVPWRFPSGRAKDSETQLITARREFWEESGQKTDHYTLISTVPLIHNYISTDSCSYQYQFWIETIRHQPLLTQVEVDDPEIQDRKWLTTIQALAQINQQQREILLKAIKLVNNR